VFVSLCVSSSRLRNVRSIADIDDGCPITGGPDKLLLVPPKLPKLSQHICEQLGRRVVAAPCRTVINEYCGFSATVPNALISLDDGARSPRGADADGDVVSLERTSESNVTESSGGN